jgi:hypothetical protein
VIGAVGYVPKLKPLSDGFLVLIILVLFLKKDSGIFDKFNEQLATTKTANKYTVKIGGEDVPWPLKAPLSAAQLKDLGLIPGM